jgi:hypothetical protein
LLRIGTARGKRRPLRNTLPWRCTAQSQFVSQQGFETVSGTRLAYFRESARKTRIGNDMNDSAARR